MKKVLSLVLAGSMVLSSISMAFAATPATNALKDIAGNDYETAIEALVALDVVTGYEDQTFRPAKTITRAELAKLLVEALGYGDLVAGARANFSDTQNHWANGYVAIANGTGLVIGYPNGTFAPDQTVTYDEAYTMIIRALGYTDASIKGTWPTNFKVKAIDLGLTDDVKMATPAADRGGVAQALYNALEVNLVTVDADNKVTNVVKGTEAQLLIDKVASYEPKYDVKPTSIDSEDKNYAGDFVDLTPYMFQSLKVYMNDDKEVVYIKGTNSLVLEGVLNAADDLTADKITVEYAKDKDHSYTITSTSAFMVNGAVATRANATYDKTNVKVTVVLNASDDDSLSTSWDVKGVVAEKQTKVAQISNEYVAGKDYVDTFDLPVVDKKVDLANVTVTGDAASLEDIQEDDVVVEYKAFDDTKTKLVVSRDAVEGKVTRLASDKYYIDGTAYSINKGTSLVYLTSFKLGDEGTFYLDQNGAIVAFSKTAGTTKYAMVVGNASGLVEENKFVTGEYTIKDMPQLKLATEDNEIVVYDVNVEINKDGSIKKSAKIGTDNLVTTDSGLKLIMANAAVGKNKVVEYTLNANNQITEIKAVEATIATIDTTKSTFKLASDAVIFDGSDSDHPVISKDMLEDKLTTPIVKYNSNGEIELLVAYDVKAGAASTFAYITKVNDAIDADGDEVKVVTIYLNGQKFDYYTDGSTTNPVAVNTTTTAFIVDLNGDVITDATTTTAAITNATASAVSVRNNMVETAGKWIALAADATVIEVDTTDKNSVTLKDLYAIDLAGTSNPSEFNYYLNEDGEIALLVIVK